MNKITILTLTAAVGVCTSSAFAGDKACCASATGKVECARIYSKLNLTPEQKAKLDQLRTEWKAKRAERRAPQA